MKIQYELSEEYQKQVHDQWIELINGGSIQPGILRSEIRDIWMELYQQGMNPYGFVNHPLTPDKKFVRIEENRQMFEIAKPFLIQLFKEQPFSYSTIVLTDKEGASLFKYGVSDNSEYASYFNNEFFSGGLSPEDVSAYAPEITLCLKTKKPAWCYGEENYLPASKQWACVAAPIIDQSDNVIGVLSLSDKMPYFNAQSLAVVTSTAKAIENELNMVTAQRKLISVEQIFTAAIECGSEGVLILDEQGCICKANNRFYDMCFLDKKHMDSEIIGKHYNDVIIEEGTEILSDMDRRHISEEKIMLKTSKGVYSYCCSVHTCCSDTDDGSYSLIKLTAPEPADNNRDRLLSEHTKYDFTDILGKSDSLQQQISLAKLAAKSSSTVLITGPSGTGKELFAQAIHSASNRSNGPFISLNCGALPPGLVESELFGYESGAFTGARKNGQAGKFESANGGTLFLDEIGEMPLAVQASILRALQTKEITRIGGNKTTYVDVRVIAATNRDLLQAIEEHKFREDLYYRLNVLRLRIPPLQERIDDVPVLAVEFLQKYSYRFGKTDIEFTPSANRVLQQYDWPGNVRELENTIERIVNFTASHTKISGTFIQDFIPHDERVNVSFSKTIVSNAKCSKIKNIERELIIKVLSENSGSITKTSESIGMSRKTIYQKCIKYGIDYKQYRS